MPSENLLSPAYYNMNAVFCQTLVGAGFACPNAPTDTIVDVFGRADPAPTVGTLRIFIYYKPFRRRVVLQKVIERLSLIDNAKISRRTGFGTVSNLFGIYSVFLMLMLPRCYIYNIIRSKESNWLVSLNPKEYDKNIAQIPVF